MLQLNPKQVEWLVVNQPETDFEFDGIKLKYFSKLDLHKSTLYNRYYLTPETYNSLPETFKQLANATT